MNRLLLVSNRLPITVKLEHGKLRVQRSPGGLATGLRGPHERSGGLWLGWPGDVSRLSGEQKAQLRERLDELRVVPLYLSSSEVNRFYEGFSNRILWPLFHYLLDRVPLETRDWGVYRQVNERFADLVAEHYQPGDIIWVHDYQLCLVPAMLRQRLPEARIGFFLHIPFPSSEVFRILPWREEILEGLLGADLVGFHTFSYARHFATCLLRLCGLEAEAFRVPYEGREVRLGVFPMGVDARSFEALAEDKEVQREAAEIRKQAGERRILLGIDRLDYTKGVPTRMLAFEKLLERSPYWRNRVRLVQVAVPSRTKIEDYEALRRQVDELVGRINGMYGTATEVPIHYLYRSFNTRQIAALYLAADVMLVTPVRDGMNLVAKEFVATRKDEDGVLVLSELAGAAAELGEALRVNPYDTQKISLSIEQALNMSAEERKTRMRSLRRRVFENDVHRWADSFLDTLTHLDQGEESSRRQMSAGDKLRETTRLREAKRLLILLEYDGTLVPFAAAPYLATPDEELKNLLRALAARPGASLHLVSGRTRETLETWFAGLPIGLHAEHGFWSRLSPEKPWISLHEINTSWKEKVLPVLEEFCRRTPGTLIEEKSVSLSWHYRMADPEFGALQAKELRLHLNEVFSNFPVRVISGEKVVEVRLQGVHEGAIVPPLLALEEGPSAILAMGREELCAALPPESTRISVGIRHGQAQHRLRNPAAARAFLWQLVRD